jgi:vitamin B12 transporter
LGDELRDLGIVQAQDAIRLTSGGTALTTGSFGGLTSVYLRGGEANYTRVLVDGVPVNDPGGGFDFAHLLVQDVERIEIVRGPTSVLYGTDAVSGVIQIFTRRGAHRSRATFAPRGGNYRSYSFAATLTGGSQDVDYGLSVGQFHTDGIHQFNNDYRNSYLSGSVDLRPDATSEVSVSWRYTDHRYQTPTDGIGNVVDRNAFAFGETSSIGVDARRTITDPIEVSLLLANYSSVGGFDDVTDDFADTLGFFGFRSLDKVVRRSADGRVSLYVTPELVATLGGQVEQEQQRSLNESSSEFGISNGLFDVNRWNRAGYVQLVGSLADFSFQVGARLDDNEVFGEFVTFRLGTGYRFASGTTTRAAYGTAFREPTFFENFAAGFVRGNPDLDPEQTRSWEVGVDQLALDGRLELSATWFDQDFEDLVEFTFATPSPTDPNYFNIAAASSRGLELAGTFRLQSGLSARAAYTYTDTKVTTEGFDTSPLGLFAPGESLLRRPKHSGSVTLGYSGDRGTLHVTGNLVGKRDDLDYSGGTRVVLDGHTTIDVAATFLAFERLGRTVTLEARVANAFDVEYEAVHGFASPGRSFLGGLRVGL